MRRAKSLMALGIMSLGLVLWTTLALAILAGIGAPIYLILNALIGLS
jgi:hypothetical protein